ncbi:MAG: hypothetical protein IJZ51_11820 [Ruminiclostridium sp.]|nr:hypothetical protein [Ruminiclostridium sp.]
MKKTLITLLVLASLTLCSCSSTQQATSQSQSGQTTSQSGTNSYESSSQDETSVTDKTDHTVMTTEFSTYSPDVKVINLIITNQGENESGYEAYEFSLHRKENGEWKRIDLRPDENGSAPNFPALAGVLNPGETVTKKIELEKYFDLPLQPGEYKIVKGHLSAEFSVS